MRPLPGQDDRIHIPPFKPEVRADLMCGSKGYEPDSKLRELVKKGALPFIAEEIEQMNGWWPQHKAKYKARVKILILYALGEYDWVWQGNKWNVDAFCKGFVNATRIEGAVVEGAPHAIDLGRTSRRWWVKCFGWALEVAESLVVREWEDKPYENFEQREWPQEDGGAWSHELKLTGG